MKQVFLRGRVTELASTDVASVIGQRQYDLATAGDPAPFFISMVIAHEGESRGEIRGLGARVKAWAKRAVRAVVHAFTPAGRVPAQVFDGLIDWHGNEHSRRAVGSVVHSRLTELAGIGEAAETIAYVYPEQAELRDAIRRGERDCCSLEADVVTVEENGRLSIDDVERGTAVVLGHTSRQMPGFPHAMVRQLCEFEPVERAPAEPPTAPLNPAAISSPVPPATVPANAPTTGATAQGREQTPLTREQLITAARQAGLTPAELGSTAPPPAVTTHTPPPVPAPPEQPASTVDPLDLWDPRNNPFLPN